MAGIAVKEVRFFRHWVRTRFPFQYGIASMTELPHLFVRADVEIDGARSTGVSADGLPPKWFTKPPDTLFDEDLVEMHRVIRHAADRALEIEAADFEGFWRALYDAQKAWAAENALPMLLANLGTSLVERAVLDALCRARGVPVAEFLDLPHKPLRRVSVRHTVGLGDPLTAADVDQPLDDGLPYTLEENIAEYGLRFFKIKLSGDLERDRARLQRLMPLIAGGKFTVDGNENYPDIASFREHWDALVRDVDLGDGLLFVEQPVHRDHALDDGVGEALREWKNAPRILIDEAEADLDSAPRALDLGYAGTSYKNCKGVMKGLRNAALVAERGGMVSGEDLANIEPVALLQDLAMMALFGIGDVERNGHHYFRGLSVFPDSVTAEVLEDHGDLYRRHQAGFPTLAIKDGAISTASVVDAVGFGVASIPSLGDCEEVDLRE